MTTQQSVPRLVLLAGAIGGTGRHVVTELSATDYTGRHT
jgi:hypothetical protein